METKGYIYFMTNGKPPKQYNLTNGDAIGTRKVQPALMCATGTGVMQPAPVRCQQARKHCTIVANLTAYHLAEITVLLLADNSCPKSFSD